MISRSLALLLLSRFALGAVTPTAPGPGEVFTAGSKCSISWAHDGSGEWKSFSIDLMSGSNSNMTLVTNVAKGLDGTDPSLSPYIWTCPDVDPYSTIYFYQFTGAADKSNAAWTTRFTIASPAGETAAPSHSKQPNGDGVPWGIGALQSGSSVAPREKHSSSSSTEEEDSDENYSSDELSEDTGQRSSNSKSKGGTPEYDEEVSTTGTSAKEGGSGSGGTSSEDSEDSEVSEDDDETSPSTKSGSSKSTLNDAGEDSDAKASKNSGTRGSNGSLTSAEDEESELEDAVSTSSRMKTVHSKPTSTPFPTDNVNAAAPTLSLPAIPLSSTQPVGCAGGTNATSSYCSAPSSTNHAADTSKLDSRTFFAVVLVCSFGLI